MKETEKMNKPVSLLLVFVFLAASINPAEAQTVLPGLRLVNVEGMRNIIYLQSRFYWGPAVQVNYTFGLTQVTTTGECVYFKFWINGVEEAAWFASFGNAIPPSMMVNGVSGNYLYCEILTAECPYGGTTIDGRLYYLYRIHIYYSVDNLQAKDLVYFGAAVETQPTLQGSSLLRLKVKSVSSSGIVSFKEKTVHET